MDRYRRYVAGDCVGGGIDLGDLRGAQPRFERIDCVDCGTRPECDCTRARNPGRVAVSIGPGGCFPPPPPCAGEPRVPYCPPCPPRAVPRAVPAPRRDDPMETAQAVREIAQEVLPLIVPLLTQQAVGRDRERDERRAVRSTAVGLTATIRSIVVMMEELIPRLPNGEVDRASTMPTSTVYAIYAALDNALSVIANDFSGGGTGSPSDDGSGGGGDDGEGEGDDEPSPSRPFDDVDIQASSPMPAEGSRDPSLDAILRKRAVIDAEPDRDMRTIAARSAANPSMYHDALRRRVKELYAKGHIGDQVFADIAGHMSNSPFGCCVKVKVDDAPVVYTAPVIEAQTINDLIGWIDRKGARGKVAVATLCVLDSGGLTMAVTSFKMPLRKTETATRSTMLSVDPNKGELVDAEADLRDPYARQTEAVVKEWTVVKEWNAMTPEERIADQKRLAEAGLAPPVDETQLRRLAGPAMESTR